MVLWIGFALLAAAVVWAVTRPLLTPPADAAAADDSELAVYRDQLAEIESERAQGLLGGAEAEGARVELARRLIQRSEEKQRAGAAAQGSIARARAAVTYAAAALPVIGIGVYLAVGSPQLSGRPYAARLDMPMRAGDRRRSRRPRRSASARAPRGRARLGCARPRLHAHGRLHTGGGCISEGGAAAG